MDPTPPIHGLKVFQTTNRVYVLGADEQERVWRVLRLSRDTLELEVYEDPTPYTKAQSVALLRSIHDGNLAHGGLQLVCHAKGLLGCVRFTQGYYLLLVTKKRYLGALCGHKVYGVEDSALLPLLSPAAQRQLVASRTGAAAELRYRKLLAGVALNHTFYFSYDAGFPVWQTAQSALGGGSTGSCSSAAAATPAQPPAAGCAASDPPTGAAASAPEGWQEAAFASDRVWNEFLTRPLRAALGHARWVLPLAHGYFEQRQLSLLGRSLTLTLVARRSREFAGTRYRKRGVNDQGHVANDVESEQIVEAGVHWRSGRPLLASCVQVRGSIPLFWGQDADSSALKPEITLQRFDPLYLATRRHFELLRERYGSPLFVLNLVKQQERRPRESVLAAEFAAALAYLNKRLPPEDRVRYEAFDLSRHAKAHGSRLLQLLQQAQAPLLRATGFFASGGAGGGRTQAGLMRTNCIDCLDRTNVAQFSLGLLAAGQQLHALGVSDTPHLDPDSSLAHHLMDIHESCGHTLAQQYGGSEAHTSFFQRRRGDWEPATQSRDVLTSIRRFYSNTMTDADKQAALNLFLGNFVPQAGHPHLWELDSDYYLHSGPAPRRSIATPRGAVSATTALGLPATPLAPAAAVPAERSYSPPPALVESLSSASLQSGYSSDGAFVPSLSQLVEGASPTAKAATGPVAALQAAAVEEDAAARSAQQAQQAQQAEGATLPAQDDGRGGSSAGLPAAAAAAQQGDEEEEHPGTPPPQPIAAASSVCAAGGAPAAVGRRVQQPARGGGASSRKCKLESFDELFCKQPNAIHHVRLTATPPPPRSKPLGTWLSPSKKAPPERAPAAGEPSSTAAPPGRLYRSNSDPNVLAAMAAVAAGGAGAPTGGTQLRAVPAARRVSFDVPPGSSLGGVASTLRRGATAPEADLASLAEYSSTLGALGGAASGAMSHLVVVEDPEDWQRLAGGGSAGRLLPRASTSYHALAGLNLEGAAAHEARRAMPAPASDAAGAQSKPSRKLSFPNLAQLRRFGLGKLALGRGSSLDPPQAPAAPQATQLPQPALAAPSGSGMLPLLDMGAVLYGAEAVRRGVDTLGVPPALGSWWLGPADPLAVLLAERQRLTLQYTRQMEQLATPLDPVEQRQLSEKYAALSRPAWALSAHGFAPQGAAH